MKKRWRYIYRSTVSGLTLISVSYINHFIMINHEKEKRKDMQCSAGHVWPTYLYYALVDFKFTLGYQEQDTVQDKEE